MNTLTHQSLVRLTDWLKNGPLVRGYGIEGRCLDCIKIYEYIPTTKTTVIGLQGIIRNPIFLVCISEGILLHERSLHFFTDDLNCLYSKKDELLQ